MKEGSAAYRQIIDSTLNSYSQVFFSNNRFFAVVILIASFLDITAGMSGLIAVLISNFVGYIAGFRKQNIIQGYYGFNSLLVGLGLGVYYNPSPEFFMVLVSSALLTFFFTVMLEGVIGKYGLPYMSVPFLLALWFATLAAREYTQLEVSETGIFTLNEMFTLGGLTMVNIYEWFDNLQLPKPVVVFFRSLGAIFFQYHLFPGLLIALGLLVYSRIAFTLSVLSFASAYLFYLGVGANISELNYAYIGFNYILTGIAVGGFFIIPSRYSYLWVILLTPLISIILTATNTLFSTFQLSIYSLPFNIIVLVFIYSLKFRDRALKSPQLTVVQHFSPEKNIYYHQNHLQRFGEAKPVKMTLPFWGEWTVTQGHRGEITHKENWSHAWDFEIFDRDGKSYKGEGRQLEDYYCFDKPVLAPADGWIEKVRSDLEDNAIGDMDLVNNWGNTVVIRHGERLFSAISHLSKDSVTVKPSEFVKRGEIIGKCGSSGRSPVPHIHFQVQEYPDIGSRTLAYPLAKYIIRKDNEYLYGSPGIPEIGQVVSNIDINESLQRAFRFVPGQKIKLDIKDNDQDGVAEWTVGSDIYNSTYITCLKSGARAYFNREEDNFYFTSYTGKKGTELHYFYLAAFRVIFGFYPGLHLSDKYPLSAFAPKTDLFWHDFIAPFVQILKATYKLTYSKMKGQFGKHDIELTASARYSFSNKARRKLDFHILVKDQQIKQLLVNRSGKTVMTVLWDASQA